jgi:monoterpene epsilon-lactone hydrolase
MELGGISISAHIMRLALRYFVKRNLSPAPQIKALRTQMDKVLYFVPPPARGTRTTALDAGGVKALRVSTPRALPARHVLYLHGGGYVMGSPEHYGDFLWRISRVASAHVVCPYYRLAPEHPFPAALDDAVAAYSWLLAQGAQPRGLVIMGDSAGGGLALATLLRLRDLGLPLPAAAVALSPWTDLAMSGASVQANADCDLILTPGRAAIFAGHYLAGADPRHAYASPLYGNVQGLPPILMQVGTDEILRDDSVRMAEKLRAAGAPVELEICDRMHHVWQLYARVLPEGRAAIARIGDFVEQELSRSNEDSSVLVSDNKTAEGASS